MIIESNYSITRLFASKEIEVTVDKTKHFKLITRPVIDLFQNKDWNICYHIISGTSKDFKKVLPFQEEELTPYSFIIKLLFEFGQYNKYKELYTSIVEQLKIVLPEIKITASKEDFSVNGITITDEI